MTVSYKNRLRDTAAFWLYHCSHSPVLIGALVIFYVALNYNIIFPAMPAVPKGGTNLVAWLLTLMIVETLLVVLAVGGFALIAVLTFVSPKNKTVLGQRTITLGTEGFVSESQYSRSEVKWIAVQKLARTRRHLFLYISQHSGFVIPRRAFQGGQQWDEFYERCRERIKGVA
ncbi:MAG: YcxB family protein [Verrucomicrobiia bacterium]|jgi:hypothetical protein